MSRLASDLREAAMRLALAAYLALAPSSVPPWRLTPASPPALVLPVGDAVPSLAGWRGRGL